MITSASPCSAAAAAAGCGGMAAQAPAPAPVPPGPLHSSCSGGAADAVTGAGGVDAALLEQLAILLQRLQDLLCAMLPTTEVGPVPQPGTAAVPVAPVAPAPTAGAGGPQLGEYEARVLAAVNRERERHGLRPLQSNQALNIAAENHSRYMSQTGRFQHAGIGDGDPGSRVRQAGGRFAAIGENIAAGPMSPEAVVQGWMRSPGHRANILRPNFTYIGIGQAADGGRNMVTQVFAA